MANDIQLKRSSVAGKTPDAANVLVGEPVVNLTDKILYTKDGGGNVIIIGAGTTSNIAEGTNQYFTNARVYANVTQLGYATTSYVDAVTANAGGGANVVLGVLVQDSYIANGTGTTYVLTNATSNANSIIVFVDSVLQSPLTNYTVSGTTLSFTSAPDNSASIDVRYFAQDEFDISIGMLNNVSNTSPLVGQALIWSGTNWAPSNVSTSANVVSVNGQTGVVTLSTANIAESSNLYFTNARVQANVTNYLSTGLVSVGNIALSTVYDVNSRRGNVGQILTSMSGNTVQWTNKFFSSVDPPDFNTINYGDIWYYITENKPYMWITDGTDDYFYDFLPPTF
jgi:hypothetical protein